MIGVDALFGFGQMQDFKDTTQVIGVAFQGGLGLPDRDYYLKTVTAQALQADPRGSTTQHTRPRTFRACSA